MSRLAVHFSSSSAEWYTPAHILDRAAQALGVIELDPCAHVGQPMIAQRQYTAHEDGLRLPWHGRVFLNPPYGRVIGTWIAKLRAEYESGNTTAAVALLPGRLGSRWWRTLRDHPRCEIAGRLKFSGHQNSAPFPSVVVYLGPDLPAFLTAFSDLGDIYARVMP